MVSNHRLRDSRRDSRGLSATYVLRWGLLLCAMLCCLILVAALNVALWMKMPSSSSASSARANGVVAASAEAVWQQQQQQQYTTVRAMRSADAALPSRLIVTLPSAPLKPQPISDEALLAQSLVEASASAAATPKWTEDMIATLHVELFAKTGCAGEPRTTFRAGHSEKLCSRCFDTCQTKWSDGASMLNEVRSLRVASSSGLNAPALPWSISVYSKCVGKYTYAEDEILASRVFEGLTAGSGCVNIPENAEANNFRFDGLPESHEKSSEARNELNVAAPQDLDKSQAAYASAPPPFIRVPSSTVDAICRDGEMATFAGGNVERLGGLLFGGAETTEQWCASRRGEVAIAQLNVHNGVPSAVRLERIVEWIRLVRPDVVGLNELNDWDAARLERTGRLAGLPFTLFYAAKGKAGYSLGILSRWPLTLRTRQSEEFCHGVLHASIDLPTCRTTAAMGSAPSEGKRKQVHFVLTHLTPHGVGPNLGEAVRLVALLKQRVPEGDAAFVMGDLNSLSPLDAGAYGAQTLLRKLAMSKGWQALAKKFVVPRKPVPGSLSAVNEILDARVNSRRLSFQTQQKLLGSGLVDLSSSESGGSVSGSGGSGSSSLSEWQRSVPTSLHVDAMHAAAMRLDYIYGNAALVATTQHRSAAVFDDAYSATLSDHFPTFAVVCFDAPSSKSRCNAGGARAVQRRLAADWQRLNLGCHWKLSDELAWKHYEIQRWSTAQSNRTKWRAEEEAHHRSGGGGGVSSPFVAVVSKRGESCTAACAALQVASGRQQPAHFPPLPAGKDVPPFVVFPPFVQRVCQPDAIRALDTCPRLRFYFPCLLGCYHAAEAKGKDHPAFEPVPGQGGGGHCLLREPKGRVPPETFDCNAHHPRTQRLCGCTVRKPERVWLMPGMRGESCDAACARGEAVCDHNAFPAINTCEHLSSIFPCDAAMECVDSEGQDQPAFVSDLTTGGAGRCLFTKATTPSSCKASHPSTQRLCPCRSRTFDAVLQASDLGDHEALAFMKAAREANVITAKKLRGNEEVQPGGNIVWCVFNIFAFFSFVTSTVSSLFSFLSLPPPFYKRTVHTRSPPMHLPTHFHHVDITGATKI